MGFHGDIVLDQVKFHQSFLLHIPQRKDKGQYFFQFATVSRRDLVSMHESPI
jgi:hypothetical protein